MATSDAPAPPEQLADGAQNVLHPGWFRRVLLGLRTDDSRPRSAAENDQFAATRDRLAKAETPTALIQISLLMMVLSTASFVLRPEYYPVFHLLDFAAAFILLAAGLWLRRPSVPARIVPWVFATCMVLLALTLLAQAQVDHRTGPMYLLIVICLIGPLVLAWRPFLAAAAVITAATMATTLMWPDDVVVDWTLVAVSSALASAVMLHLRLGSIRDEVHARQALADEQRRLELVLGASRLGLWDWDMQTDEAVLDEQWAGIVGYRLADLEPTTSNTWTSLTHPDDLPAEDALTEGHAQGRVPFYDIEFRMRHRDGHWVWVRDRGQIVEWSPEGRPLRMTGTLEDISRTHAVADQLAAAEEQFRLAMDNSAVGMCLVSREGRFLRVNPALCHMLGRSAEDLQSLTWQVLTYPDDLAEDLGLVEGVLDGSRHSYRMLKRFIAADESVIWADLSVAAVRNVDGTAKYLVTQIVDVTDRIAAERSLAASEDLLRDVLNSSQDVIMQLDRELRVEYVNSRISELTGLSADDLIGMTPGQADFPGDLAALWEEYGRRVFESGEPLVREVEVDTFDGRRWYEARLVPEFAADGSIAHVIATSRDVTARKADEESLRHLATHDALTGLANRTALIDEVTRALSAARRSGRATAVLMIDLDHFKNANDTLGHAAGDAVLQSAAARIEAAVRGGDLVARPGGDEFVIVMRDLDEPEEAIQAARRLVHEFRRPFTEHGGELYATASIGIAIAHATSEADQLVLEADTAMYAAKAGGRDRVMLFNEELRTAVTSRLALEADLRHALERGQLAVWYQPEVDLTTGSVIAVEALLRWHHPDGDVYTADRFIEIAEETGLILDIGDWVLQEACSQAASWIRTNPDRRLTVRVNVSALQLAEAGLLGALDIALSSSGLDPSRLCIEITETALLHETAAARENLEGIRARGTQIALDDFGTGYASLAYLRQYPVDVIKIDRSFITHLTTSDYDHRLVAGIIVLAEALDMKVTAEGVEHPSQAALLKELGCPGAQGYLYSRAVPADQVDALLGTEFPHG
jgi:diguanylate cyclase (GGDEF)-like protein/PAS domain S-box-containing protein